MIFIVFDTKNVISFSAKRVILHDELAFLKSM